jgi:hypothetical protein
MRFMFVTTASFLCMVIAGVAQAAMVQRINEEHDKLIVELTAAELAMLEEDEQVVIEAQSPRFVTTGVLKKMNLQKKTVVIVLDEPDTRFARRQRLVFLPYIQNTVFSERISNIGQYHQYNRSLGGGEAGYIYQTQKQVTKLGDTENTDNLLVSGYHFGGEGYLLFDPEWFGLSFGYERRGLAATTSSESNSDTTALAEDATYNFEIDYIRPAAWIEVERNWRVGLSLDYYMVGYNDDSLDLTHSFALLAPRISAVRYNRQSEFLFYYQDRAKFESVTSTGSATGVSTEVNATAKIPAELGLAWRAVSSPTFVWSSGLAWIFYERELTDSLPIRRKAGPEELLRLSLGFEHRLVSGSKFEWSLNYAGAQNPSPLVIAEQDTNQLQLNFGYHMPYAEGLLIGGNFGLSFGMRTQEEESETEGGDPENTTVSSFGGTFALFVQKDFDLLDDGRRKR